MKITLSGNLLRFSNHQKYVDVEAETVEQAIHRLVDQFPSLHPVLLDGDRSVRRLHRLFLNGELLDVGAVATRTSATDELSILTALAGG